MEKRLAAEREWEDRLRRTQDEVFRLQGELQNKVDTNISLEAQVAKLEKDISDKDEYFKLQLLSRDEQTQGQIRYL